METKPQYWEPQAGRSGMTELHFAAYSQDLEAVKKCVEAGADIHLKHDGGWTPLVWAVDMASTGAPGEAESIVDYLVSKGASLDYSDDRYKNLVAFAKEVNPRIALHIKKLVKNKRD